MRYIITGTSGFIGTEILAQALLNPLITSLLILSRRPLPAISSLDSRIKVVVLENFLSYPDALKSELTGVKAVLWYAALPHFSLPSLNEMRLREWLISLR
jgi:nucleoside-diphosphate-sugar epimerase